MPTEKKVAVVEEIRTRLSEADSAMLTEYRGLTVTQLAELRAALRPAGTEYKVFKNRLAKLAVEGSGLSDLLPMLEGPVAIAFVKGDAVIAAKALRDFGRTNPALVLKGGLMDERLLTAADLAALADVLPRDVLLARLAGGFQAPLTKAAGLFQAFTRNFAYGIKAYADQRVAAGETAEAPTPDATESESDAERAPADGVPPAAASEAVEEVAAANDAADESTSNEESN
ncbi:MAG: 50S ribosomal protein L10 [Actinobacteria bacterium]|nr:50S ribosomal protein L10 [Actinomycetota bacterium]